VIERLKFWWNLHRAGVGVLTLRVRPGDVLVIHTTDYMSDQGRRNLGHAVERILPGTRVLVMDGGLTVSGVLAKEMSTETA
jgi:hypothetical protein